MHLLHLPDLDDVSLQFLSQRRGYDVHSVWSFRSGRIKLRWFLFYLLLIAMSLSKEVQVFQKLEVKR